MYNDYPTVFETLTNYGFIYYILLGTLLLIVFLAIFISLSYVFGKANRSKLSAWIPIYNIFALLEIVNMPKYYFILLLIPVVNIYFLLQVMFSLAKLFRKSRLFALGLTFLPFIFYPILAFSKNEYIGINLVAMEGNSVASAPILEKEKLEEAPTVHEEEDVASQHIGISIGGGIYQKDYTNTLLQVDKKQEIEKKTTDNTTLDEKKALLNGINPMEQTFINQELIEEDVKEDNNPSDVIGNYINIQPIDSTEVVGENNFVDIPKPIIIDDSINDSNIKKEENKDTIPSEIINIPLFSSILKPKEVVKKQTPPPVERDDVTTCPKCGTYVKKGTDVCFICGYNFDQN